MADLRQDIRALWASFSEEEREAVRRLMTPRKVIDAILDDLQGISPAEYRRLLMGTFEPVQPKVNGGWTYSRETKEEEVSVDSKQKKLEQEAERLQRYLEELKRQGFSQEAQAGIEQQLAKYRAELAFDPKQPFGEPGALDLPASVRSQLDAAAVGLSRLQVATPVVNASGWAGPYTHTFTSKFNVPDAFTGGIEWLKKNFDQMVRQEGLGQCALTFEQSGTFAADHLRWKITRSKDGAGLTGHIELTTDPQVNWDKLITQIRDALETLAYIPEGASYIKGP